MDLTSYEKERYARQLVLSGFGIKGQLKLKQSIIYVIGAGGLGSSLLLYLAAAGVGKIIIIDGDVIQLNNLQRQVMFQQAQIGLNKAKAAQQNLSLLNSEIEFVAVPEFVNESNCMNLLVPNSLIADCSDNFKTRYLINDFAVAHDCTLISASVYKFQLQFGVYNLLLENGERSATYRCAFPQQNIEDIQDTCASTGILGVIPGFGGMLMANEIIKIVNRSPQVIYNRVLTFDTLTLEMKSWNIKRQKQKTD